LVCLGEIGVYIGCVWYVIDRFVVIVFLVSIVVMLNSSVCVLSVVVNILRKLIELNYIMLIYICDVNVISMIMVMIIVIVGTSGLWCCGVIIG